MKIIDENAVITLVQLSCAPFSEIVQNESATVAFCLQAGAA